MDSLACCRTRPGLFDVPMLETNRPGAKLTLDFEGTAVGIFCVSGPAGGILEYSVMVPIQKVGYVYSLEWRTVYPLGVYVRYGVTDGKTSPDSSDVERPSSAE